MVMAGGKKNLKTMNDEHMVGVGRKYDNNNLRIHFLIFKITLHFGPWPSQNKWEIAIMCLVNIILTFC